MMRIIRYVFWLALILAPGSACMDLFAQDYREQLFVHHDRDFYLAGERIQFAVYCFESTTGKPTKASKVACIELLDLQGNVVAQGKARLEEGSGWGCLEIPPGCNSEQHILRCYTSWMRNSGPETYSYHPLLVIHPAKSYTPAEGIESPLEKLSENPSGQILQVIVGGLKESYSVREPITFSLQSLLPSGPVGAALSVSVTWSGCFMSELPSNSIIESIYRPRNQTVSISSEPLKYLPDMEGLQLTGTLEQQATGDPVADEKVILSFIDSLPEIYSARTDRNGRFRFDLNGITGRKDLVIQPFEEKEGLMINIDPDFSQDPIPASAYQALDHENLESIYLNLLLNQQLSEAYEAESLDSAVEDITRYPFYGPADHLVVMDEFIELPVMEEVFRELGKRIYLQREEAGFQVTLLDLGTNRIIGNRPYYLLDGVPFFDPRKLLGLDPASIASIRLKSQKYFVGDLAMDGIIDIRTRNGDAGLIDLPRSAVRHYFLGFQEHRKPCVVSVPEDDLRIPVFRSTLFFDPQVQTLPGTETMIRMVAPDARGSYDLVIRGISTEGIPAEHCVTFRVE